MPYILSLILLLLSLLAPFCLSATTFPSKNLTAIVPFSPGGGADLTTRIFSEVAPKYLQGYNLFPHNIPGDGGLLGQAAAATAPPDGYTLLTFTNSAIANSLLKAAPYSHKDFTPILMYCFDPQVLVVPITSPHTTMEEFLQSARKKRLSIATPGHSTSHHISSLLIEQHFAVTFSYVHTTSGAQQITHLLGKHVSAAMMTLGEVANFHKDGSLRILGIMSDAPYTGTEHIERFSKFGLLMQRGAFRGFAVPAHTPEDVVQKLSRAFLKMSNDPLVVKQMQEAGFPMMVLDNIKFTQYVEKNADFLKEILPKLAP